MLLEGILENTQPIYSSMECDQPPFEQQAITKMPESCVVWPCCKEPQKAKLKLNNGFMICPLCRRSYGKP